jgi:Icc-related predicted phosphoesterase
MLYITDIHGNNRSIKKTLALAKMGNIENVVFGGDIAPNPFSTRLYKKIQIAYVNQLMQMLKKLKGETKIFMMPGNDDVREVIDILNEAQDAGIIRQLHGNLHEIDSFKITGYSFVPKTPFQPNDWDKDDSEIQEDLKKLPIADIFVFHAPPLGTKLDVMSNREHIGSNSIGNFIRQRHPKLTLHGHIHESRDLTGEFMDKIGDTICINPGASGEGLNAVVIDVDTHEQSSWCFKIQASPDLKLRLI